MSLNVFQDHRALRSKLRTQLMCKERLVVDNGLQKLVDISFISCVCHPCPTHGDHRLLPSSPNTLGRPKRQGRDRNFHSFFLTLEFKINNWGSLGERRGEWKDGKARSWQCSLHPKSDEILMAVGAVCGSGVLTLETASCWVCAHTPNWLPVLFLYSHHKYFM